MKYVKMTFYTAMLALLIAATYFLYVVQRNAQGHTLLDLSSFAKGEYILMKQAKTCANWAGKLNLKVSSIDDYMVIGPFMTNQDTLSIIAKLGPCGSDMHIINHT